MMLAHLLHNMNLTSTSEKVLKNYITSTTLIPRTAATGKVSFSWPNIGLTVNSITSITLILRAAICQSNSGSWFFLIVVSRHWPKYCPEFVLTFAKNLNKKNIYYFWTEGSILTKVRLNRSNFDKFFFASFP
jgi:hypothetical protein